MSTEWRKINVVCWWFKKLEFKLIVLFALRSFCFEETIEVDLEDKMVNLGKISNIEKKPGFEVLMASANSLCGFYNTLSVFSMNGENRRMSARRCDGIDISYLISI